MGGQKNGLAGECRLESPRAGPFAVIYYDISVMQEIRMLLDFIAGNSTMSIEKLEVTDPWDGQKKLVTVDILNRLSQIDRKLGDERQNDMSQTCEQESSFLLLVRNALNTIVRPASALTIAYTGLVAGHRLKGDQEHPRKSRWSLAKAAFPQLAPGAMRHRLGHYLILVLALLLTSFAVWESAKVALGKALLQNLQDLRTQQVALSVEKARLEADRERPGQWADRTHALVSDPLSLALRLCDRPRLQWEKIAAKPPPGFEKFRDEKDPKAEKAVFDTPAQRDVCDRDKILAQQFGIAKSDLKQYQTYWPAMIGSLFHSLSDRISWLVPHGTRFGLGAAVTGASDVGDVEFAIAPALAVHANYILPVIFAFLGAAAFVILDFYGKVRESVLVPRDHLLSWIRLGLGLMIGGCIGLLVSSYAPPTSTGVQSSLIASLTLSASGLAFLAGFGVEGVFSMLQTLVRRIFPAENPR